MGTVPIRCAIWARVSTDEQDSGNQLADLREWAERRGFEIVAEYILDGDSAFKGEHRAKLAEALAAARLGRFEVMLTWALDRISREGVEETLKILRQFREQGAAIWSLKESWTETSDQRMAELLGAIFGWMAAEESRHRSERTRAGIARKMRDNPDWKPGRQVGAKDKGKRKRAGYVARAERNRGVRA